MEKNNTIESRVADAILEKEIATIEIDGTTYKMAPPTVATLIMVSQIISRMPIVERVTGAAVVNSVLHHAKDFHDLGELAAVMILGAKNLYETKKVVTYERKWCGLRRIKCEREETIDRRTILANQILQTFSPSKLYDLIIKRINDLDIPSFCHYHFPKRSKSAETDKGSGLNDSIWATVLGIAKTFGVTPDFALHGISYTNAIMYSRVIPIPGETDSSTNDAPLYDDSKDACQDIDLTGIDPKIIEQYNNEQ